jgi:hypothetical protein
MRLNPFAILIESKKYKFSRLLRATYVERLMDCFWILYGGFLDNDFGLVDYVFPFGRICQSVVDRMWDVRSSSKLRVTAVAILVLLSITLNIVKLVVSTLLTIAVTPIISLVHFLLKPFYNRLANQIEKIQISPLPIKSEDIDTDQQRSSNEIQITNIPKAKFQSYFVRPVSKWKKMPNEFITYQYWPTDSILYLGVYRAYYTSIGQPANLNDPSDKDLRGIIEINSNNWIGIMALLKSNILWASTNLEDKKLTTKEDLHNEIDNIRIPLQAKKAFLQGTRLTLQNKSPIKTFVTSETYHSELLNLIFQFAGMSRLKSKVQIELIPESSLSKNSAPTLNR